MKMIKLLNAIKPLQKLANADLPLSIAYSLKKLFNELQIEVDFYVEERQKGTSESELLEFEIGEKDKIIIPVIDTIKLSINDLEALEPFIVFKDEVVKCNT